MPIRTFLKELIPRPRQNSVQNDDERPTSKSIAHICRMEEVALYWFCANIQLRASLVVLEKHGTFHQGPPTQLPRYGATKDGKWIPIYKSQLVDLRSASHSQSHEPSRQTKTTIAEYEVFLPPYIDSDIGPIPSNGGEYLHFVKAFRQIIEKNDATDFIITQLKALLQHNSAYQAFAKKHAPDFVTMWFLNTLLAIPGLNPNTAQRLFTAGYRTIEELRVADDLTLREKTQIDEATLVKIRRFVGIPAQIDQPI